MLGVNAAEEREDPVDGEPGRQSLTLEHPTGHHLDVPVARPEQASKAALEGVEASEAIERHDDASRSDAGELAKDGLPVRRGVEMMEQAHREDVIDGAGLEGKAAAKVRRHPADVPPAPPLPVAPGPRQRSPGLLKADNPGPRPKPRHAPSRRPVPPWCGR